MSKPPSSGSIISVVPRLLIKNPAMPSHRKTVVFAASNASAPNGWVFGARACRCMAGPYREGDNASDSHRRDWSLSVGTVEATKHSAEVSTSPFAPFRHRVFFWLWLGVVISSVGMWGQTVGAQWLFVNDPNAATIVPLVQTASTLPMMVLALPAGVLADAFDRRLMMLAVQTYVVVVAVLLAVLTALNLMPAALLLAFVFAAGAGMAMNAPTWQSLITELVPRSELAAATRLDMVSVNVSRAAGPALAGFVIARWGIPPVFAMTAVTAG